MCRGRFIVPIADLSALRESIPYPHSFVKTHYHVPTNCSGGSGLTHMHTLSAQQLIHLWEVGLNQHPLDRALTILTTVFPGTTRNTLASLTVGQRYSCL